MPESELMFEDQYFTAKLDDNPSQLQRLKTWWHDNVSRDITFTGAPEQQYKKYYNAAINYHNIFLTNQFTHMNAIQYAAQHGYNCYIDQLNEGPEAFELPDNAGMTPLHWAAYKGYIHTLDSLLKKGANPEKTNDNLQMPIYSALLVPVKKEAQLFSHKKVIFNRLFKLSPGSIKHQDNNGDTVFHLMAGDDDFNTLLKKILQTDVSAASCPNNLKQYPIHTAILNNQIENVRILLDSKIGAATQADREGRVALHYAAQHGSQEMTKVCIDGSEDINVLDNYNKTPLILAAENNNQEGIVTLLHHHANPDLADCDKQTYLDYIRQKQQNNF